MFEPKWEESEKTPGRDSSFSDREPRRQCYYRGSGNAERRAGVAVSWICRTGRPATAEGVAFDAPAALAATLPVKAEFGYLAPAFLSQNEDFWRGFMIAMSTDNAARFSKDEAQQLFIEARCAELTE